MTVFTGKLTRSSFASGGSAPTKSGVFIAYRFSDDASETFRDDLGRELQAAQPGLEVLDGRVPGGVDWAEEIRERLKSCRVFVADIRSYSREIMFEMGFAARLDLSLMTVLVQGAGADPPGWLRRLQYRRWPEERLAVINEAAALAVARGGTNPYLVGRSAAGGCVTVNLDDNRRELVDSQCSNMNVVHIQIEANGEEPSRGRETFRDVSRAGLVIGQLAGTRADSYIHFLCGEVAAAPKVWGTGGSLRRILLTPPMGADPQDVLAHSVRRVDGLMRLVEGEGELVSAIADWRGSV